MAWNEPGGNNQDPWGSGKKGDKQGPPDLDDAFRDVQKKLGALFGGGRSNNGKGGQPGSSSAIVAGILVLAAAGYLWNAIYTVDEKEQAVILRFGEYQETVGPGLHVYFPPMDVKYQERVTELRTYNLNQQMLTEDENIVEVAMSVQYNIDNIKDYVLNVAKPLISLEEAAQSALRHTVGGAKMYQVLTEGREVMGIEVRERLQSYLNSYGTGLKVSKINIESAQPPKEVQIAFDDVIRAREDEERAKNKAQVYANKVVPESRGQAKRIVENATGYRDETIAKAEGEAARFTKLLAEYQQAPEVTRERLYIETIEDVLSQSNKVLVDVEGGNNMMYLPLDKLMSSQAGSAMPVKQLTTQEINDITTRVTDELNKRVSSSRISTGRSGR